MFYRLLSPLVKLIIRIFYRSVEIHGREKVPQDRPVLFAANHPNMIYDPFMVGLVHQRRVHFLGKSGLFKNPLMGWMLRSVGAIPVYRRSDNPADVQKNRDAFAECYRVLEHGNAIGIFPEGTSLDVPRLLPLKTGAARIVFEAEEKNDFKLNVVVVPVGLHFLERQTFRSDVLVQVGDPIEPSQYFEKYRTDAAAAVHALTDQVEEALRTLTRNLDEDQDRHFVDQLRRIYIEGYLSADPDAAPRDLKSAFDVDRALIEAYAHFAREQPERTRRVQRDIERYLFLIEWLGISDRVVAARPGLLQLLRALLVEAPLLLVLGVPIVLYALITGYLPYRLTGVLAGRVTTDRVELATYKTGLGGLLYTVWYALLAALVAWRGGPLAGLLAFLSFPIVGLFALVVAERIFELLGAARTLVMLISQHGLAGRLKSQREAIIAELRDLRRQWGERAQTAARGP